MASSTTSPVARTIPNRVNTLMEKSSIYMMKKAPISEIGMATAGISVDLQSRRKKKITIITKAKAIKIVMDTSSIAARIGRVASIAYPSLISSGKSFFKISTRS